MTYREIVAAQLRTDEGWKAKPYRDTVGKLTAGCGRNLDDVGLRDDEIALMLENDIRVAERDAKALFECFDSLTDARKAVLVNMSFNLGKNRLAGFLKFRAAVEGGQYERAADEMQASKWADQVGDRAKRLAKAMKEG